MFPWVLLEFNWSNVSGNWSTWAFQGYDYIFGHWLYPLMFMGVVGYVYALNRSAVSAAAVIGLVFGVFGITGVFAYGDVAEFSLLSWIIMVVSFAGMFTALFVRRKNM